MTCAKPKAGGALLSPMDTGFVETTCRWALGVEPSLWTAIRIFTGIIPTNLTIRQFVCDQKFVSKLPVLQELGWCGIIHQAAGNLIDS